MLPRACPSTGQNKSEVCRSILGLALAICFMLQVTVVYGMELCIGTQLDRMGWNGKVTQLDEDCSGKTVMMT